MIHPRIVVLAVLAVFATNGWAAHPTLRGLEAELASQAVSEPDNAIRGGTDVETIDAEPWFVVFEESATLCGGALVRDDSA